MAKIRIKNIGPLKDTGIVTLPTVLLIIGKQSSGKSTFLKILCYCRWLEKLIMISDEDVVHQYTHNLRFVKELKSFHRLNDTYFSSDSEIIYDGDTISISLKGNIKNVIITRKTNFEKDRYNSKLSFIPSERNLVSAIRNVDKVYRSNERDILFNFLFEWDEAKSSYDKSHPLHLSVSENMEYHNDNGIDIIHMVGTEFEFTPFYASSGVQSVLPIDVMADYFTKLVGTAANVSKHDLTRKLLKLLNPKESLNKPDVVNEGGSDDSRSPYEIISRNLNYQSVQLFIEEPEQNLYPDSQKVLIIKLIRHILSAKKKSHQDCLLATTTHSPYIISVVNALLMESSARLTSDNRQRERLDEIAGDDPLLPLSEVSAYYINQGIFENIINDELPMVSGMQLDNVSDWVDDKIARVNDIVYGEE